ncbi:site-specific integrase [uncultured Brevundimonas sp.]|uniref:site-specific integrase n=1 Tax=uncultured Brevundimonas sp. TaxID=213418 RepID=UPI0025FD42F0|nr:site-specific integrase [uncultured Brevundimonas sp.]
MDGKLHVYRRENSRFWQCATYLSGRNYRQSTKETNIAYAREFARDWYLDRVAEDRLRRHGVLPTTPNSMVVIPERIAPRRSGEKTFREAAAAFEKEYAAMTLGERNAQYVASKGRVIRLYLNPFFGDLPISEVSAGRIQDYRLQRVTPPEEPQRVRFVSDGRERIGKAKAWKRPSRQTLHNEMVCLRQILKSANRKGWISALPDMSNPYRTSGKISQPTDLVFGLVQRELLNAILDELGLKKDRDGKPRTAYSLRHTYISMRLMEGADIYQVAKNCRTSVEMIEKYYASHIKNVLDASAINVRKAKPAKGRAGTAQAAKVD